VTCGRSVGFSAINVIQEDDTMKDEGTAMKYANKL
jgi:hypothetical protein